MRNLESFDAWKCSRALARAAYTLTTRAPLCRHFVLVDQIRRAAVSIPANIAEGYALGTTPQFLRCLRIALGSAAELQPHLDLVCFMKLAPEGEVRELVALCDRVLTIILGLIRKLAAKHHSRLPSPVSRSVNGLQ